jgi:hypothetical protein
MTYDNFKNEIVQCFRTLIDQYNFSMFEDKREKGLYLLRNTYCSLWFSFDRGQIGCAIESKAIDTLDVLELFTKANPRAPLPQSDDPWSTIVQLNKIVFMIENSDLKKSLTGDDSWLRVKGFGVQTNSPVIRNS